MIAISSHRPFAQSDEIKRNQLLAKRSWEMSFKRIIYFGDREPELLSGKTTFVACENFPRIRDMMIAAGGCVGFVVILNADIVVDPAIKKLERMMSLRGKLCASSRRYQFDPNTCDFKSAQLGDARGRDIFIARNDIWRHCSKHMPEQMRIAHGRWDAVLTDTFRRFYNESFLDFTNFRVVFHPEHGERLRPHEEEISKVVYAF